MVEKNKNLPKLIVALITPLKDNEMDRESLARLISFQLNHQVKAIFILGTTGEFHRMSLESKKQFIQEFYKIIASYKEPLFSLMGISSEILSDMVDLIHYCENYKVDALVITPLFGEGDPKEKINLALQNTSKPVILYNNPTIHSQLNIPLELLKEFAHHPQVIGIKDSSGNATYFSSLLTLASKKFHIYQGSERNLIHDLQNKNLTGIVSGTANIAPSIFNDFLLGINLEKNQEQLLKIKSLLAKEGDYIKGLKKWLYHNNILSTDQTFPSKK